MKKEVEIPDDALSDELKALFEQTPVFTEEQEKELADAVRKTQQDPIFHADLLKARVVEAVLAEMDAQRINKNQLAKMWNKSRQYVGRILNEHRKVNFTLETISELLHLVGKRMDIQIKDLSPASSFETREATLTDPGMPTCQQAFWLQNSVRSKAEPVSLKTNLQMAEHDSEREAIPA